jgi:hypothetical protein
MADLLASTAIFWQKNNKDIATEDSTKQAAAAAKVPEASSLKQQIPTGVKHSAEQLRKVAFGQSTVEQQRFNAALSAFLGVSVKLPLLTPGAMVLDLKRLFMEVHSSPSPKLLMAVICHL